MITSARRLSAPIPGTAGLGFDFSSLFSSEEKPMGPTADGGNLADSSFSWGGLLQDTTKLLTSVAPTVLPMIVGQKTPSPGVVVLPTTQPTPVASRPANTTTTAQQVAAKNNTLLYVGLGVGAVVLLGGFAFLSRRK